MICHLLSKNCPPWQLQKYTRPSAKSRGITKSWIFETRKVDDPAGLHKKGKAAATCGKRANEIRRRVSVFPPSTEAVNSKVPSERALLIYVICRRACGEVCIMI
jgi:hypothetical protein